MTTDDQIQEILTRGVDEVIDRKHLEVTLVAALDSKKELRVKLGIDPTGSKLHLGHAVTLWKLRALQDLGHKAVLIIGDFTALIGDTSDKESERPILTRDQVVENLHSYMDQVKKILNIDPEKLETRYNSDWLKKLNYLEISEQADQFGLHEFSIRDNIARRMGVGKRVSLREVLYPLMQGYDSVEVRADIELGAIDQRFNLLAGRDLQKYYKQAPQDVIILKYLIGTDGRKMSKSWGNVINISDDYKDMFGKVMAIPDDLIIPYFELATQVPLAEIREIEKSLTTKNPRDIKALLAEKIVELYYGPAPSKAAGEEFNQVFSKGALPENIEELPSTEGSVLGFIANNNLVSSRSEAKRLVDQKAVKVNGEVATDWDIKLKTGDIIQVGPRKFAKVK